uniref:Uncharacterized protein n=1 Tax=Lepeophtheirus salmonis TaxID=72036 RepID=A0A0K2UDS8_LEPSM
MFNHMSGIPELLREVPNEETELSHSLDIPMKGYRPVFEICFTLSYTKKDERKSEVSPCCKNTIKNALEISNLEPLHQRN